LAFDGGGRHVSGDGHGWGKGRAAVESRKVEILEEEEDIPKAAQPACRMTLETLGALGDKS